MELIYATGNRAKLMAMQRILEGIDIKLNGLGDTGIRVAEVEENGRYPLENAEIKARAYYSAICKPLFSVDSGLYFEDMPAELQPGVNVRNVNGKRLSDDEMIEYYSGLAREAGGQITARYINGICLVASENEVHKHTGEDISYSKFIITDKPHKKRIDGFPLDSLSIHIASGQYYYDLRDSVSNFELVSESDEGFRRFFAKSLGFHNRRMS